MKLRPLAFLSIGCALLMLMLKAWLAPSPSPLSGGAAAGGTGSVPAAMVSAPSVVPAQLQRLPVYTYLTIPEWYLVWSSDEYADFIAARPPSEFPYRAHLDQFWSGYRTIYDSTKDRFAFDGGYHMMIGVIGFSTSVEYGIKAGYEKMIGRIGEIGGRTAEDSLAATMARDYVTFIRVEPWYRFDFVSPLKALWTRTGFWGTNPLRKWERKYFLTSEYAVKAAYGWLLGQATGVAYGEEKPVTAVVLDRVPERPVDSIPDLQILERTPAGVVCTIPRYQAFTHYARSLASMGIEFRDIAGNNGAILISAIVPSRFADTGLPVLMRQPITTRPGKLRLVLSVPVRDLASTIRRLDHPPIEIEHIYDY